ncbi:DNA-deoxyinosine glycosylase [Bifidobacterium crudilactis]|jgi:hypoxanthine-DNA glycosylase|uniref:DNA-deoxyinosine glycosylase n=1 Tax=Bifidobacterium crudilactis TaxID=327277 RepID=A0A971D0E5_9BIFI|nr:DNA-deoxyinosine glycosylase [Bifidobacterium crudilactis]MCI1868111.1 DNA-deoxyinosine glycosylase [Bifidobacterium crudilactis]MDN5971473.1 DNA-deoxyinosine glycosylase [Bifidobacterium crudilactis]MDN6001233.1 DNA-deoxyinosine glycosylase [Bifidobacterium crudilactis]MDN6208728.1 DNA-deoxyinosine glycosylase [Bifidobacterium crudilactis]MDN6424896.1 DNA-deoxyinosine glycosylase [Bifidobacterium crudilactis]
MGGRTHVEHGFGPVWDTESRVLLLGSMPSPKSREAGFYYMHPRNRFWPVLEAVFAESEKPDFTVSSSVLASATVAERTDFAVRHHLALWDVLESCDIIGASDSSIRNPVPTDLSTILTHAPIRRIFTTGGTAAALFRRYSEPALLAAGIEITMTRLPSTSPANAAMHLPELIESYHVIAEGIE